MREVDKKHGDECLTLRVFLTTLSCDHNRAARTSASENVQVKTGAQTKQQAIRVQQRDGLSRTSYEVGWFGDTVNRTNVCSSLESTLSVIWVSEMGWPGVWVSGIWVSGVRVRDLED